MVESDYEEGRRKKQAYLIQNIIEAGYDAPSFALYMEQNKGN